MLILYKPKNTLLKTHLARMLDGRVTRVFPADVAKV